MTIVGERGRLNFIDRKLDVNVNLVLLTQLLVFAAKPS